MSWKQATKVIWMTEWEQRYFERVIIIMSHIHHDSGLVSYLSAVWLSPVICVLIISDSTQIPSPSLRILKEILSRVLAQISGERTLQKRDNKCNNAKKSQTEKTNKGRRIIGSSMLKFCLLVWVHWNKNLRQNAIGNLLTDIRLPTVMDYQGLW